MERRIVASRPGARLGVRLGAALLGCLLMATGCTPVAARLSEPLNSSDPAPSESAVAAAGGAPGGMGGPGSTVAVEPPGVRPPLLDALAVEDVPDVVIADLDDYWGGWLRASVGSYEPPAPPLLVDPGSGLILHCGAKALPSAELDENALYCPADDYVAWDDDDFFPRLAAVTGMFAVALVLAHEWGHVVQARTARPPSALATELQADCYAGSWTAHVRSGASRRLRTALDALDVALAGYLAVRDPPGSAGPGPSSRHGSAFARVGAFADGLEGGPARCAAYVEHPPGDVALPVTPGDAAGRELPLADVLAVLPSDLDKYWVDAMAERAPSAGRPVWSAGDIATDAAGGAAGAAADRSCVDRSAATDGSKDGLRGRGAWFCAPQRAVRWDVVVLDGIRDRLGDFAAAFVVAEQWGAAVAQLLGSGTAECWTGTYAAHSIAAERGPLQIRLSGGDLDEALAGVLAGGAGPGSGTVLDRVSAFRRGFLSGPDGCHGSG